MKILLSLLICACLSLTAFSQEAGSHARKFTRMGFIGDWQTSALQNVGAINSGNNFCERSLQFSRSKNYTLTYKFYTNSSKSEAVATIKMKGVWKNVGPAAGMRGVMDFNFYPKETLVIPHTDAATAYFSNMECGTGFVTAEEKSVKPTSCLFDELPQSTTCDVQYGLMKFDGDFTLMQGVPTNACEEKGRAKKVELKWDRKE